MRLVQLEYVRTSENSEKFWDIAFHDNGTATAYWGRIGQAGKETQYSFRQGEAKLAEKIGKGYVRVSRSDRIMPTVERANIAGLGRAKLSKTVEPIPKTTGFLEALDDLVASADGKPKRTKGA